MLRIGMIGADNFHALAFSRLANLPPEEGGSGLPAVCAASAGTRLSRISVVLPEPDTPVTTVSRPLGMSTSSGLTVWMASVERWMRPSANSSAAGRFRGAALACPPRNGPIWDAGFPARSATVPSAMTCPPPAPASGPISMSQSDSASTCVS